MSSVYTTVAEAQEATKTFQHLLSLTHWDVRVEIVDNLGNRLGEVNHNINKRQAIIRLRSAETAVTQQEGSVFMTVDHERTLIHELLHLHLAPLDPLIETNPLSEQIIETAVHTLSFAIKNLLDVARRSSIANTSISGNES